MKQNDLNALLEYLEQKKTVLKKIEEVIVSQNDLLSEEVINDTLFDSSMEEIDLYREELDSLEEKGTALVESLNTGKTDLSESEKKQIEEKLNQIGKSVETIKTTFPLVEEKAAGYLALQRREIHGQRKSVEGIRGYFRSMGGLNEDSTYMDNKI